MRSATLHRSNHPRAIILIIGRSLPEHISGSDGSTAEPALVTNSLVTNALVTNALVANSLVTNSPRALGRLRQSPRAMMCGESTTTPKRRASEPASSPGLAGAKSL